MQKHPKPQVNPLRRPDLDEADIQSFRAAVRGEATPDQQKRMVDVLINKVCDTYGLAYRPYSKRDTDFALGKQNVGQTVVWILNVAQTSTNPDKLSTRKPELNDEHPTKTK